MSEYQYYEFLAVDRRLTAADRAALRQISSRGRITATSFTNEYQWGDFKGDAVALMRRCFDLHLYFANWGSHRLMLRLPARLVDRRKFAALLHRIECAELIEAGDALILDIRPVGDEGGDWDGGDYDDENDDDDRGGGRLAAFAPLRTELLQGDLRLFYLLWLMELGFGSIADDAPEPLPGVGPLTDVHQAFADFFGLDADLLQAAAERSGGVDAIDPDTVRAHIAAFPDRRKTELLVRVVDGDPHVGIELRRSLTGPATADFVPRTAGDLRAIAETIRQRREAAAQAAAEAERQRKAAAAEQERRQRIEALVRRGERVWTDVEDTIARRNAQGYQVATSLLADLRQIAEAQGTLPKFSQRFGAIRERYSGRPRLIERLAAIGAAPPPPLLQR